MEEVKEREKTRGLSVLVEKNVKVEMRNKRRRTHKTNGTILI